MGDFNIEAPSLIEVFKVADELKIMFDLTGTNATPEDTEVEEL